MVRLRRVGGGRNQMTEPINALDPISDRHSQIDVFFQKVNAQ
jgi:hypothetical protein